MDEWLAEAKRSENADKCGMFLFHNGIVRSTAKAAVRNGEQNTSEVTGMDFSYDPEKLAMAISAAEKLEGIYYVRVWLNEGTLRTGDDIMLVLIGGDIRPHVVDALQSLVGTIKSECVTETEIYA